MRRIWFFALIVLVAVPTFAADIDRGLDLWRTAGNGTTFIDFSANPIPAGFFCGRSGAFTGKVVLEGVPLAADQPAALGGADTIVERLDDVAFNRRGVATTRIQVRALSLASVKPLSTECGLYALTIALSGDQPTTTMRIVRVSEDGGYYRAPLALTARLTFTPLVNRERETVELVRTVTFERSPKTAWTTLPADQLRERGHEFFRVDTDGDQEPDRDLVNTSTFAAGIGIRPASVSHETRAYFCEPDCHCDPSSSYSGGGTYSGGSGECAHLHCPRPVLVMDPEYCSIR